jgi:hypothetical protein
MLIKDETPFIPRLTSFYINTPQIFIRRSQGAWQGLSHDDTTFNPHRSFSSAPAAHEFRSMGLAVSVSRSQYRFRAKRCSERSRG